jgi:hypothetical protein
MVKITIPNADGSTAPQDWIEIDLKQPAVAAVLAWLVPGLGHVYQGRTGKGILFFVCVLGTFFYGLYLGGGKVVYAAVPWEQQYRWQYWCQLGTGLVSMPMLVQRHRVLNGKDPWGESDFMAPPGNQPVPWTDDSGNRTTQPNELALWTVQEHPFFELGTVYTVIAGLLNVLVICDAAGGPLILTQSDKDKKNDKEKQDAQPDVGS